MHTCPRTACPLALCNGCSELIVGCHILDVGVPEGFSLSQQAGLHLHTHRKLWLRPHRLRVYSGILQSRRLLCNGCFELIVGCHILDVGVPEGFCLSQQA